MRKTLGTFGAVWGLTGIILLLTYAMLRLGATAMDALAEPLTGWQWAVLIINMVFMAHTEGYKGFQKNFSPRVVARAKHVLDHPSMTNVVLAPLFCMGYFNATRRRLIVTYGLTAGIVALVIAFRFLPQPWRGVLDAGVVVGLTWGVISIMAFAGRAMSGRDGDISPELAPG
tara:strand:- start:15147 stop:15662 length:516 start_codon:yes stop_codon:yes gene_type:complete